MVVRVSSANLYIRSGCRYLLKQVLIVPVESYSDNLQFLVYLLHLIVLVAASLFHLYMKRKARTIICECDRTS